MEKERVTLREEREGGTKDRERGKIGLTRTPGLHSSGYDVGRYMPTVEQAAYHFHQQLYAQLAKE